MLGYPALIGWVAAVLFSRPSRARALSILRHTMNTLSIVAWRDRTARARVRKGFMSTHFSCASTDVISLPVSAASIGNKLQVFPAVRENAGRPRVIALLPTVPLAACYTRLATRERSYQGGVLRSHRIRHNRLPFDLDFGRAATRGPWALFLSGFSPVIIVVFV